MADLKPIGSEKLQGTDKIARIMEIARYRETPKEEINLNETLSYTRMLADGNVYGIVKERNGYIVKKGVNESTLDYIEPMKNRKYYNSYSQALKRFNLLAGEINRLTENTTGVELFGEQKKFVLKKPEQQNATPTPSPEPSVSTPPPAPEMTTTPTEEPAPEMTDMGSEPMGDTSTEPTDDMSMDMDMDTNAEDSEEVTFKTIQKLTGKLGQKLRTFEQDNEMSPEDVKYVLNSVLSALDLSVLEDTDIEEIIGKLEGEEGGNDANDMSAPAMEPTQDEVPLDLGSDGSSEVTTQPEVGESQNPHKFLDKIFSESKVEKILSKYFVITEEEKKQEGTKKVQTFIKKKINKVSVVDEIKRLSETIEQELTADFILSENENVKFIGKTNLKNLVFESEGKQIKVSPKGMIL
jgi:hypothetical protein